MDKVNEKVDKIGVEVKKGFSESYYRFLTVANLALTKVAKPVTESAFHLVEKNIDIEEDRVPTTLSESIKKNIKQTFTKGRQLAVKPLEFLGDKLKISEHETAKRLKEEYGIDTNQWIFSRENLEMLEKINKLADLTFSEVNHVSTYTSMRYLSAWTIIQKLSRAIEGLQLEMANMQAHEAEDGITVNELKEIQKECMHYATFAHGTYGDVMNYVYSAKDYNKIFGFAEMTKQFLLYTKVKEEDLFHAFWDATPYRPSYCIARDHERKAIVLCMRGSNNWADWLTDFDFHYICFSIIKENDAEGVEQCYLKFNFEEPEQTAFKQKLGDNTKIFNEDIPDRVLIGEEVVETGYTHSGMMVSAIQAYKEITPKLEEILSKPENEEYNLVITGHSLGGGMSTLLTFLYSVHPLKAFNRNMTGRLKGYSYGGASVLSRVFEKYMHGIARSVVFHNDVVPRLSYGSISDICKIILMFDELEKDQPQIVKSILDLNIGKEFEDIKQDDIPQVVREIEIYKIIKAELYNSVKLYQMGRTFFFEGIKKKPNDSNPKEFTMREIKDKRLFEEIIFSRELVKHHFPHVYEQALLSSKIRYMVD